MPSTEKCKYRLTVASKILYSLTAICLICIINSKVAVAQFNKQPVLNYTADLEYKFINIVEEDGLCYKNVLDIIKDKYGYMWFATENALSNNCVTALAEDKFGQLWIGTNVRFPFFGRV